VVLASNKCCRRKSSLFKRVLGRWTAARNLDVWSLCHQLSGVQIDI
jgi:hypothetical protein